MVHTNKLKTNNKHMLVKQKREQAMRAAIWLPMHKFHNTEQYLNQINNWRNYLENKEKREMYITTSALVQKSSKNMKQSLK